MMKIFNKKPYRIRMRGVNSLEYVENDKTLTLEGERLASNQGASLVYWIRANHTWDHPLTTEISSDEKTKIKNIIEQYFKKLGTIVEVEIIS